MRLRPPGLSTEQAQTLYDAVPASTPPERRCRQTAITVDIDSLNEDGRGVGRHEGKVVFVEGGLPGERVQCCISQQRARYNQGWSMAIDTPSAHRVPPPCPHFGICGGCNLQHLDPEAQPAALEQILRDKFRQFGQLAPEHWLSPLAASPWGYRRKARLGVRHVDKKGGTLIGFRERASKYLTPLRDCLTLDDRIAALLPALRQLIEGLSCRNRIPQVEVACTEEAIALVFRHLKPLTEKDIERLRAFGVSHDCQIYRQPEGPDSLAPVYPDPMPPLCYQLPNHDLSMEFKPTEFIQINARINQQMIDQALQLLKVGSQDTVIDLFCGLGNFSLPLARHAARVIGVENSESLLASARQNARRNQIDNVRFVAADLYDKQQCHTFMSTTKGNLLLLDPPRSGAMEVLENLPGKKFDRILYISCQPATLARDCHFLVNTLGYHLSHAGIMDMFPQTSNVESIALLTRT